jgi:3-hydroxyisobutyrate dehydrogenase
MTATIGFVGLGNMGLPMALNLLKAGHKVAAFDLNGAALRAAADAGAVAAASAPAAIREAQIVVTMLPEGRHVRAVCLGSDGLIAGAHPDALLIDCSTIDVETSRAVHAAAAEKGLGMVDAPVSGGVPGAEAATLTFMVGGTEADFARARPVLERMGKTIIHAGPAGNGQAAKICNNMLLGIHMISVAEAFGLAQRLGLEAERLFEIVKGSSGQCWSMTTYCPVPGLAPAAASNREFQPGFTAAMMLKDLRLAQTAAAQAGAATPLGAEAAQLYGLFARAGNEALDFSAIIKMITGTAP